MSYPYYQDPYTSPPRSPLSPYYTTPTGSPLHGQHHAPLPPHSVASYGPTAAMYPPEYHLHTLFPRSSSLSLAAMSSAQMATMSHQLSPSAQLQQEQQQQPRDTRRATLYKTELCRSWEETGGHCKYGDKCQVRHRPVWG